MAVLREPIHSHITISEIPAASNGEVAGKIKLGHCWFIQPKAADSSKLIDTSSQYCAMKQKTAATRQATARARGLRQISSGCFSAGWAARA
ncbi:hypothetical protein CVS30_01660 [Arthrobacter psychrolactophilus]|uniref:Uncharacterized protein n=1 Tax=Arthrobacter psychrolactophilus TaxID=92442 RepID=A0A2V5JAB2_9MICC|nr:hypothetical protein CVS30_01660 [Arthrobacter psychrolactophilus]